jgi:hypothetical protein
VRLYPLLLVHYNTTCVPLSNHLTCMLLWSPLFWNLLHQSGQIRAQPTASREIAARINKKASGLAPNRLKLNRMARYKPPRTSGGRRGLCHFFS